MFVAPPVCDVSVQARAKMADTVRWPNSWEIAIIAELPKTMPLPRHLFQVIRFNALADRLITEGRHIRFLQGGSHGQNSGD
jgi:hypothetical protein